MIVTVNDGENIYSVKATGTIEFQYGHALFDDGVTFYDCPVDYIVGITDEKEGIGNNA